MSILNQEIKRKSFPNEQILSEVARKISEGHSVTLTIRGNSMNPFLVDGRDQVILSPFKIGHLKVGKVILAQELNGRYLLHRIVGREGNRITMLGDGNVGSTEEVFTDNVIGVLTKVIRKGRYYDCDGGIIWKYYSLVWKYLLPIRSVLLRITRYIHNHRL